MKIELSFGTILLLCCTLLALALLNAVRQDRLIDAQLELTRSILSNSVAPRKGSGTFPVAPQGVPRHPETVKTVSEAPTRLQCAAITGIFRHREMGIGIERVVSE